MSRTALNRRSLSQAPALSLGLAHRESRPWQQHASPPRRRVVVTGMGAITPLGIDVTATWQRALAGQSGIANLSRFDTSGYGVHIAGEIRDFDASRIADRKERRYLDDFCLYALAAAIEAIGDAALVVEAADATRIGIVIGSGFGGLASFEHSHNVLLQRGPHRVAPHAIPAGMANAAAAHLAQRLCLEGPNQTVMTACAAGAHAIGTALRLVQQGDADVVVAGGAEAPICPSSVAGFSAMGALSRCTEPERASRPFDARRDGFVLGEGAGILVLEALDHAARRGARIHAEVLGYGASADAYHVCAPDPDGTGAARAMSMALADARVTPHEVDYVNAHGTSTRYNDLVETRAIKAVLGEHAYAVPVSAAKSMLGHLIGAGAAVESILTIMTLQEGIVPQTLNQEVRDPECDLDHVAGAPRRMPVRVAVKNAFGFGGANACLVYGRFQGEA
jgi:3-oxoacyl-[acyl-carrier-protein] synthase II